MRPAALLLCLMSACAAPKVDTADTAGTSEAPARSPYAPDAPAWTAAEMTDALTTALAVGLPDATSFGATYVAAIALRDETCPSLAPSAPEEGVGPWRADGCTTAGGITFDGDASEFTETALGDDGVTTFTRLIGGAATVADASGVGWHHTGQASLVCETDGTLRWESSFSGTFDAAWGEGWLVDGGLASVFFEGSRADGETTTQAHGGVRTGGVVLHFEELTLREADTCSLGGELRVEDPTGWWWRLPFDGGCDACATRWWEDVDGGEVCLGDALLTPLRALTDGACS